MKEQKRGKKPIIILIVLIIIALAGTGAFYGIRQRQKANIYSHAEQCFQQKDYFSAKDLFNQLGSYKDSAEWIKKCDSQPELDSAASLMEQGEYEQAREIYKKYNLQDNYNECTYQLAISYADSKEYEKSIKEFEQISSYKDVSTQVQPILYDYALTLFNKQQYAEAQMYFKDVGDYKSASDYVKKCNIGIKYEKCNFDTLQLNTADPIELYTYAEDQIGELFYQTWYDVNDKELVIDKDCINGLPYQVTSIEPMGAYPAFKFHFVNDTTTHTICRLQPVTDEEILNFMENISFDSVTYYEYDGEKQKEILSAAAEWLAQLEKEAVEMQLTLQNENTKNDCWNDAIQRFEEYIASNYALSGGFLKPEDIDFLCKNKKINLSGPICTIEFTATNINTWSFTGSLPKLSNMNVIAAYNVSENGITCTAFSVTPAGHSSYW